MALSEIGKKIQKREVKTIPNPSQVVFGLPQNQATPDLKGTMSTAQSTKQTTQKPVAFKAPEVTTEPAPKPSTADILAYDKSRGVSISEAPTDSEEERRSQLRKIPLIGTALFGRGYNKVYEPDTIAGTIEEKGVTGFLFEGFQKTTSPTRAEQGERVYERYEKLVNDGIDEQRAWEVAVQDTINKTAPNFKDINALREAAQNPTFTLTDEEEDILYWTNAKEKLFTVLDAPVFAGSTKIAKEGVTELVEKVAPIRDTIINRLEGQALAERGGKRVQDVLGSEEQNADIQRYLEFIKDTPDPSISQLNEGLEILRTSGREYEDVATELINITQDISKNPSKYIRDEATGQFRGSTKAEDLKLFEDTGDVTVASLTNLEGRGKVSKQFISDSVKSPDVKQAERDIINDVLTEYDEGAKINVAEFADKVKARLLPVEQMPVTGEWQVYESINLPSELRGDVASYIENIYKSPIENSAGGVHFSSLPPGVRDNYFAHTRIEDMADDITRRVIEVQSDLFQKGRLERETKSSIGNIVTYKGQEYTVDSGSGPFVMLKGRDGKRVEVRPEDIEDFGREAELVQLQPYRNTWWERIIREEVKKAALDGKSVLQFPTGETAMKIEGLGEQNNWTIKKIDGSYDDTKIINDTSQLKVGDIINANPFSETPSQFDELVVEIIDDSQFKTLLMKTDRVTVQTAEEFANDGFELDELIKVGENKYVINDSDLELKTLKPDTNNPIYKFYEKDVQKYLTKKYGAKVVTDENGVSWVQMAVNKEAAERPVEAFAGGATGIEEDEEGNVKIDPKKAFLGMAAAGFLGLNFRKFTGRKTRRNTDVPDGTVDRLSQPELQGKTSLEVGKEGQNLSSSNLSESLTKAYAENGGESIVDIEKAINPATMNPRKASPKDMTKFAKLRETVGNKWTEAIQWFQDDMIKVRNLVNNPNVKVTDDTDPYLAELLFHGRIGGRLTSARDTFLNIDKDIITTAKTNGVPDQDMTQLVNKFLHSRHTPERNAKLGDGAAGMTNAEAEIIQREIEALPYGKEVERIANQVQEMNNQTLDILLEAQVIDKEAYDAMRNAYQNHIPLQRVLKEDEDIIQALTGRGFDVKSTGIKRAKGSQREVADVMTNVVTNYEQALIRAEKNRVDLTTLAFARDNKELGLFEEVSPKAIGRMFGEEGEATGAIIKEAITDPRVLTLRENGKPVFLKIKDEDLAVALKGISRHQVPSYLSGVRAFTAFYSGLQTRFNPEFAFPNKIRDLQEAVVYAGSRGELGFSGGIKGALDQKAYKDVLDNLRGVDSEGANLYQQMIDDGGTTGGMALSTREAVELDIEEIRKLNRSNPRAAADKIIRSIDGFNTIFEDSTRLALYKQALNNGVSRKRAAMMAKEASVNFNKFGRGGPIINSLWMFSNASIQGSTKMLRAMKNPKVAVAVSSSVFAGVYATGEWNDTLDENWREKVTEWDRINSLVVVLPSASEDDFNYVTIPVGWGIKPIKVSADYLYDASVGKGATSEEALGGIVSASLNAYNPVGGTDLLSGMTPTIADIPSEIYRNQAWHGGKIMPDWDERKDHLKYFPSLTDNTTGEIAVEISSGLTGIGIEVSPASIYYAYQGYVGGAGRTLTDSINTMISVGRGEMPNPNDIPIYSRFVKQRDIDEIGAGSSEHERVKQLKVEQDSAAAILSFDAEDALKRLSSMETEEAANAFDEIVKKDPELAKKISSIMEEQSLGLTYTQRNLKSLNVESRANYIYDKLESLDSDEARAELWDEYTEKKIITASVAEKINDIRNGTAGESERPKYKDGQTTTQRSFIETIKVYAEAIGTDPVTAFNRMFTGQRIRRIDGGAIIVERMPFTDSQAVRDERGATDEMRLDHTLPLQLGGSNAEDNLKLVPYADWERYTAVENMLGEALRTERIESKKAQELILDFKAGKLTSQQVRDAIDSQ